MPNIIVDRRTRQILKDLLEARCFGTITSDSRPHLPFHVAENRYTFADKNPKYLQLAAQVFPQAQRDDSRQAKARVLSSFFSDQTDSLNQDNFSAILCYAMALQPPDGKAVLGLDAFDEATALQAIHSIIPDYALAQRLTINSGREQKMADMASKLTDVQQQLSSSELQNAQLTAQLRRQHRLLLTLTAALLGLLAFLLARPALPAGEPTPTKGERLGEINILFRMKDSLTVWPHTYLTFYETDRTDQLFVEARGIYRNTRKSGSPPRPDTLTHTGVAFKRNNFFQIELFPKNPDDLQSYGKVYITTYSADLVEKLKNNYPVYGICMGISNYRNAQNEGGIANLSSFVFVSKTDTIPYGIEHLNQLYNKLDTMPAVTDPAHAKYKLLRLFFRQS